MDLEDFCAASYTLLAEEHQRINPLKDLLTISEELAPEPSTEPRVKTTVVAQKNANAIAQLNAEMAGVQKRR